MKQKLLFFISIVLLFNFRAIASEDNLPQLPAGSKLLAPSTEDLKLPELPDLGLEQEDKSPPTLPDSISSQQPTTSETSNLKLPSGFEDAIKEETPSVPTHDIGNVTESPKIEDKNIIDKKNDVEQKSVKTDPTSPTTKNPSTTKAEEKKEVENKIETNKESLPVPSYAIPSDETKETNSGIGKLTKTFTETKTNKIELPKITENDYANSEVQEEPEIDPTQLQFVNNETQVLLLPDDDIVLGELTEAAKLYYMDLREYIEIFWNNYNKLKREPKRQELERFLEEYDENFNQEKFD
jgi:uncharacterized protein